MAIPIQLHKGRTVELRVTASGYSDVIEVIGEDLRGVMYTSSGTFSATSVAMRGNLNAAAKDSNTDASWKTITADIAAGVQEQTEPWNLLQLNTTSYSSGTLVVFIKAY